MKSKPLTLKTERYPYACQWEITCRCNFKCVMCYTDVFNTPEKIDQELTTQEIKRIMDELAEAGCLELGLTGGEPLSRPDFFDLYEYAIKKGFITTIFTNAALIQEKAADFFAQYPPERIEISIHGYLKDTFDTVTRVRHSWDRVHRAVTLLLERHLPVLIKSTAMILNQSELLNIKQWAHSLGVPYLLGEKLRKDLSGSFAPRSLELPQDVLDQIRDQDPHISEEVCSMTSDDHSPCVKGTTSFHIDAYGKLQLCSDNRRDSYDLRTGSFKEGFYDWMPRFRCPYKFQSVPT